MTINREYITCVDDTLIVLRGTTVFIIPSAVETLDSPTSKYIAIILPINADLALHNIKDEIMSDDSVPRISAIEFIPNTNGIDFHSLVVLVNDRFLLHYEINWMTQGSSVITKLVSALQVPRNASCMLVAAIKTEEGTRNHIIVIGQSTGDVIAVPLPKVNEGLINLLGHTTSMVTHMAINYDASLLLTADRDEKIRVSHFPSTDLIQSYCLGHTASLINVKCCINEKTKELAVSTSLDNTIKLWDIRSGDLLSSLVLIKGESTDNPGLVQMLKNVEVHVSSNSYYIVVVIQRHFVRVFSITPSNESTTGKAFLNTVDFSPEDEDVLKNHRACHACWLGDGSLILLHAEGTLLKRLVLHQMIEDLSESISSQSILCKLRVLETCEAFKQISDKALTIPILIVEESNVILGGNANDAELDDYTVGGLQKKRLKTHSWKEKLP